MSAAGAGPRTARVASSGRALPSRRRNDSAARKRRSRERDPAGGSRGVGGLLGASLVEAVALVRAEIRLAKAELAAGAAAVSRALVMLAAAFVLVLASCVLLLIAVMALLAALGLPVWLAALTVAFFGFLTARACVQVARGTTRPLLSRSRAGARANVRALRAAFGEDIGRPVE